MFETAHVLPPQKKGVDMNFFKLPSLKLTAKAPEDWWFENKFSLGTRPMFREDVLVSFRECKYAMPRSLSSHVLNM